MKTKEDFQNLYMWLALQTVANNYYKAIRDKIITRGISQKEMHLEESTGKEETKLKKVQ